MHNMILQISTSPIPKDTYICEEDYYDTCFLGSVADYVSDMSEEDRRESLKWLSKEGISFNPDRESFVIEDKRLYFKMMYEDYHKMLAQMATAPFEAFSGGEGCEELELQAYVLYGFFWDRYGTYVDDAEGFGRCPWLHFARRAEEGREYFVGGVLDYHC